ncbi:transposase [Carboxylicivirga marina]|uniref:Transposase n=1 Tax=Carboxylicivirga marina TaxID=2800988 RepID=A0ABS1HJV6_9BACT|nr:transposase [Carboxylicivirga marina]MBK3517837.1 transposase [Carboxylicivirga marina]
MRQKENLGYEQRGPNGKIFKVLPDKVKRELVSKIESGEISIDDVMIKYNIRHKSNITKWLIKFGENKEEYLSQKREHLAPQQKIKILSEYNPEEQTVKQYCEEVGITATTFRRWEKLYSCNLNQTRTVKMRPVSEKTIKKISEGNAEFIKELEDARLKIAGLETMINLAEKDLNVSIRKKYGTKQ